MGYQPINKEQFYFKKTLFGMKVMIMRSVPSESPGSFDLLWKAATEQEAQDLMLNINVAMAAKQRLNELRLNNPELFI